MNDVCQLLGITKLNTTAYHPQCDGMVERFNYTLKAMIRKYAAQFDDQWDRYLPGLLWAYRNTPLESTGEKPFYLLFGIDCRTPTEAALLPPSHIEPTELSSYREEMILSLSTARNAAAKRIQKSQKKNKDYYDRRATHTSYRLGDWILIRFPAKETGARKKLSRPWHGPYRVISKNGPDVTATKVYFPTESQIQVHMSRTCACPTNFPAGYYLYGSKRKGPGRPPKWVEELMNNDCPDPQAEKADKKDNDSEDQGKDSESRDNDCDIIEDQEDSDTMGKDVNDPFIQKDSSRKVDPPIDTDHSPNKCDSMTSPYSLRKQVKRPQRDLD